ncbi:hypothetical protein Clacol_002169 [Clathrus columnatus]|uniref:Protein kinase domain-containing protein n=1 Tax=Clathrus columnatus TaxID=1419009 RepID=A0AAV5A3E0_9AGAM|nr:hypothetical protein Clacol_002169 [Clathrus columnatus]
MLTFMNMLWKRRTHQLSLEEETPAGGNWEVTAKACMKEREDKVMGIWEPLRNWFAENGYILYTFPEVGHYVPSMDTSPQTAEFPDYPYAFCGGDPPYPYSMPLEAHCSEKVCFAQDMQGRHVTIKKLRNADETDEICIYQLLLEKNESLVKNCVLPIIEILEYEGQYFAVMPRWGDGPFFATPASIRNVLHYIRCLLKVWSALPLNESIDKIYLKAVNFLHSNAIDLKEGNTLINHFGTRGRVPHNLMRPKLLSAGRLTYALFDFDLAQMLPSTECRLPSTQSFFVMSIEIPFDTSHGELDYDPYKFEMGCLGIVLCQMFQHCIPFAHFLAPFLDRLITDRLELRLTAKEALEFFEEMHAKLTPEQLAVEAPVYTLHGYPPWQPEKYDRWEGLPDEFIAEWGHFRAPKPSFGTKLLRWFCRRLWGERIVINIRRFVRLLAPYVRASLHYLFYVSPNRLKI